MIKKNLLKMNYLVNYLEAMHFILLILTINSMNKLKIKKVNYSLFF